jgi:hypothetical protein
MDPENQETNKARRRGAWGLWIGVIIMFLLVISAWTVLINIAKNNPVETIEIDEPSRSD